MTKKKKKQSTCLSEGLVVDWNERGPGKSPTLMPSTECFLTWVSPFPHWIWPLGLRGQPRRLSAVQTACERSRDWLAS